MENSITESNNRVDPEELDCILEMLRRIENRTFVYDVTDSRHSRREDVRAAWDEIACELKLHGKQLDANWCKKKWKSMKDYYYKYKKSLKGKSGGAHKQRKPWAYFAAMERMLSDCTMENLNTLSNFSDGDDSEYRLSLVNDGTNEEVEDPLSLGISVESSMSSTPSSSNPSKFGEGNTISRKKRKAECLDGQIGMRMLDLLEKQECSEKMDEAYHFGMSIAFKLRKLSEDDADLAMKEINEIMYNIKHNDR